MRDYYLQTWYMRVDLRIAEQLNTYEIWKYHESVQTPSNYSVVPSPPTKTTILLIMKKTLEKQKLKLFP